VLFELHDSTQGKTEISQRHHVSDRGIILAVATDKGFGFATKIDADAWKCIGFAAKTSSGFAGTAVNVDDDRYVEVNA